ncbi:MAG: MFS transporter [Thermoanaerobaculia bacterium]|nr:MFS transporter [Thermoanaerobaculia bacterium]
MFTPRQDPGSSPVPTYRQKLSLIGSLYVAQAIPLGFFLTALPVILREGGLPHETVGLFAMVAMPWILKWAWAPFVDRFGAGSRHGHYRSWIAVLQTMSVAAVVVMSWIEPSVQLVVLAAVAAVFMLVSATQDVATDGLSVRILGASERGPGNGWQVGGYYLGQVLGGGVMLVVFSRFGWSVAMLAMASFLALPLAQIARFRESSAPDGPVHERVGFRDLGRFLKRTGSRWVAILLVFRIGETVSLFVYHQHLVDLGLGLDQIGFVVGVVESLAAFIGALLGGHLLLQLGRRTALVTFASLQAGAIASLLLPTFGAHHGAVLLAVAAGVAFTGGMATAALYTAMMDAAGQRTAGTDFTLQQSLAAVGPIIATGLSGFVVALGGYGALYALAVGLALLAVTLVRGATLPQAERLPAEPDAAREGDGVVFA